ncbi:integrase, partial [Paraburkholderia xenovorans]
MTTALPAPRPLDALELPPDLPPDLDGRHGTNRANGRMQVAADTDPDALRAWLARFAE